MGTTGWDRSRPQDTHSRLPDGPATNDEHRDAMDDGLEQAHRTTVTTQIPAKSSRSSMDDATYMAYCYCRSSYCQDEMLPEASRRVIADCDLCHKLLRGIWLHG